MIHRLVIDRCRRAIKGLVLPVLAGILASSSVSAQTSTGSIRGFVRGTGDAPLADAQVAARDIETNQTRGAITNASGAYNIGALRPATYEVTVRRIGLSPQTRSIRVLIGQTLDVSFQLAEAAVELAAVQVVASAQAETRTSEVATNITQAQIENLPTSGRNILDLASLAPGVRVSEDRIDATSKSFAAGAQNAEQVNLFVDGTTYKNDIIAGGVAGQDASRGNPFPRNAIQEFRIATNNFKAEYQKASSAIITAVTKSGTNQWEGSSFLTFQNARFVALDS
ncbi:MAG: carboxypeptidase-like regulatory domain-containing protein, partial [Gemmatimonadota bacterium]|nr:carboxypeptidase-like regulatory domain-containing protein [Gemmatimonadota bacterium]